MAIDSEMEDTKNQISQKEEELGQKEEELFEAQAQENDQYESMKKRIKYMYENGNTKFVDILCQSKDISEFLNNAEYNQKRIPCCSHLSNTHDLCYN